MHHTTNGLHVLLEADSKAPGVSVQVYPPICDIHREGVLYVFVQIQGIICSVVPLHVLLQCPIHVLFHLKFCKAVCISHSHLLLHGMYRDSLYYMIHCSI